MESLPSTRNILHFNMTNCGQFEDRGSKFGILGPICIPAEEEISPREGRSNRRFRNLIMRSAKMRTLYEIFIS